MLLQSKETNAQILLIENDQSALFIFVNKWFREHVCKETEHDYHYSWNLNL